MPQNTEPAQFTNIGGYFNTCNITAPTVIRAQAGCLWRIFPVTVGSGTLSINDSATTEDAAAANLLYQASSASLTNTPIELKAPCQNGITVSAVPDGGVYTITWGP